MTWPPAAARRVAVDIDEGTGAACGTFGELLQGVLPDGTAFLVTLPISLGSRARFRYDRHGPLHVYPAHKTKSLGLARSMLDTHGAGGGGTLLLDSDLLVGKGLASSSADLVATARGVGAVLGIDTSPGAVEDWLRPVEPTDGVMHPGIVVFEHRAVRLRAHLGALPPVTVVAVDEGGRLDTVAHNRRPRHVPSALRHEYAWLVSELADAVRAADLRAVGAVTTRSAVLNQRRLPKRNLEAMTAIAERVGAPGVVCTHSGTMLGLLLDATDDGYLKRLEAARSACAALPGTLSVYRSAAADR
ncbi:kinase [Streptomyces sp. NPDC048565]|uniref:GHMP family kinase ATP-binding protein n=1 Tax=Streptomyces sp. NPDC048565 TaxID=3155266 RepID=UPI003426358C